MSITNERQAGRRLTNLYNVYKDGELLAEDLTITQVCEEFFAITFATYNSSDYKFKAQDSEKKIKGYLIKRSPRGRRPDLVWKENHTKASKKNTEIDDDAVMLIMEYMLRSAKNDFIDMVNKCRRALRNPRKGSIEKLIRYLPDIKNSFFFFSYYGSKAMPSYDMEWMAMKLLDAVNMSKQDYKDFVEQIEKTIKGEI